MNYRLRVFVAYIIAVCAIYSFLFISIQINAFSSSFYSKMDTKYEISEDMNISSNDYQKSMTTLLDYLEDKRDDIDVTIDYHNKKVETFNKKEADHMVDVKALYVNARYVFYGCMVGMLCLIAIIYFADKSEFFGVVAIGFKRVGIVFVVGLAALIFYASVDFTSFWTAFHHIFFRNDLWLLNPATDRMIQMLPEVVFFSMVVRIIFVFVSFFAICLVSSILYIRKLRKEAFEVQVE